MAKANHLNWQPISQMLLIAGMIKGSLDDTRGHLGTLTKVRDRLHVLDDNTIDRSNRCAPSRWNSLTSIVPRGVV